MLENTLSTVLSLDGIWQFHLGDAPACEIIVPSAWEACVPDRASEGPARYRRTIEIPNGDNMRVLFEADAVSYACELFVNGRRAGAHTGMWAGFQIDITAQIKTGSNVLELVVWKPGQRFPVRECVAGFLPDVAQTFGGIWQSCRIRVLRAAFAAVFFDMVNARVQARVDTHTLLPAHEVVSIELWLDGRKTAETSATQGQQVHLQVDPAALAVWHLGQPNPLCRLELIMRDETGRALASTGRDIARRTLQTQDRTVLLNAAPAHLRGVLDWGWHPNRACPTPTPANLRQQIQQARALGFNMLKLCLFVPDTATFEIADQLGMALWLEMPLWQPVISAPARKRILEEYEAIFRRVHHHPSVLLLSLGCELDSAVDAALLADLRALARRWLPHVLLCDNSGSAEAYGGDAAATGDFRDYHFYCDPHFFQPLLDAFDRPYQTGQPWIFGEFCDADTLRNFDALDPGDWWLRGPFALPRPELAWLTEWRERLAALGVHDGGAALTERARKQATLTRKTMLETTRKNFPSGGYVLTGWRDTPLATSGVVDDQGALKFEPDSWRAFNADRVLLIDRPARREWTHGGDRPAPPDPSVYWNDEALDITLSLANGGGAIDAQATLGFENITRAVAAQVASGTIQQVLRAQLGMPCAESPVLQQRELTAAMGETRNAWPLLFVPRIDTGTLTRHARLVTTLTQAALERVIDGEHLVVWIEHADARFCRRVPFVREAIHVIDTTLCHGIDPLPHLFGIASDLALDVEALADTIGATTPVTVVWQRVDARAMTALAYIARFTLGAGQLTVTSLRHAGGLGAQPVGMDNNPLGAWLLQRLLYP